MGSKRYLQGATTNYISQPYEPLSDTKECHQSVRGADMCDDFK